jgi:Zn-dependent protease with chaperone function
MVSNEQPAQDVERASTERFATVAVRSSWPARKRGVGPIDSHRIRAHRFNHEHLALVVALLALIGTTAAVGVLVSHQAALLIIGAMVAQGTAVQFRIKALVGQAAEVTPAQFAGLYAIARRDSEALDLPPTRIFVVQDPNLNAFSFGLTRPYGIVLTSSLVQALEEQELAAAIGHEMGHIKFGHTRVSLLFGGVDVPLGIPFIQMAMQAPFLWWTRCAEFSADRAGYAACGRVSKVIAGLVKVAIGPQLYEQVRPDELARQADEFYRGPWAVFSQLRSSHPFLVSRIQQIIDFAGPPEPGHALNLARPDGLAGAGEHPAEATSGRQPHSWPDAAVTQATPDPTRHRTLASELPASEGWLMMAQPDGRIQHVRLPDRWMTGGRGADNDLVIADPRVSFRHFGIRRQEDGYTLHDLNSRNGTQVNGMLIREVLLHDADEIRVGDTRLVFVERATPRAGEHQSVASRPERPPMRPEV